MNRLRRFQMKRNMVVAIAIVSVLLFGSSQGNAMGTLPEEHGTVTGRTLSVVHGHPGALSGSPDSSYKPPQPAIAAKEKLYWLCINDANKQRLFSTESDTKGNYRIVLPTAKCYVEPAATHVHDLQQINGSNETIIRTLFPPWRINSDQYLKIEKQKVYNVDVEARILFVD
jgi:hypothetical protein